MLFLRRCPLRAKIGLRRLNYVDHSLESGFTPPNYPTIFARFSSSLIGHGAPDPAPRRLGAARL